ncbi:tRNA-queuosine alpha-mannosyltransferase domain-containing protein [Trichloromonas sp.]|uniref:tRNA-queuosine alpha-mannosyltransferase domain-containing protein n=1 Tax=Trichloromonas sp. TaxID=3069249 RepID=UPI003D81C03C
MSDLLDILLLEPYLAGSHAAWAQEYAARSRHRVRILGLSGQHWKWRMHGGAATLARRFFEQNHRPDLLLASDMLDLTSFLALTRSATAATPAALYFHENQLTYPWSPSDADPGQQRDAHYAFINYSSALAADAVLFNSDYHRTAFLGALGGFLGGFPDHNETAGIDRLAAKSRTLPLGLDLRQLDAFRESERSRRGPPLLLWNHRWEYDKNPEEFFQALFRLDELGIEFELAVLGESFRRQPPVFAEARERLGGRIVHWGFAESFAEYAAWLWRADILPVTSIHDFFGVSVVQAMYCNTHPLLPRRLAYPEHVPVALQAPFFYSDFDELVRRLAELCRNIEPVRQLSTQSLVSRYDWGILAGKYDRLFEEMVTAV